LSWGRVLRLTAGLPGVFQAESLLDDIKKDEQVQRLHQELQSWYPRPRNSAACSSMLSVPLRIMMGMPGVMARMLLSQRSR